jgi:acetyl esterase/lipase
MAAGMAAIYSSCALAQTPAAAPAAKPTLTLSDLFADPSVPDTSISPSGRYLAAVVRNKDMDVLVVRDLKTDQRKGIAKANRKDLGEKLDVHISYVQWKTDDRLLMRLTSRPAEGVQFLSDSKIARLGDRLMALNRDGSNVVAMLAENRNSALDGAFDLGDVRSFLPHDPENILMTVDGWEGRSLFKVNLTTGRGEIIERPSPSIVGWWLDVDGNLIVRVEASLGTLRFYRKEGENKKWKKFHSIRISQLQQRPEYDPVGPSDKPGLYYVLARPPGHDRIGLYLYDLEKEAFGDPVVEHATYDLSSAAISRDGTRVLRYCYIAHVRTCESSDKKMNAHMKGVRKFFNEQANVYVYESAQDNSAFILYVEGPSDPPTYYFYRLEGASIEIVGAQYIEHADKAMPTASVVHWKARDGLDVSGYLTRPPNSANAKKLPLIVYAHGGPEARDYLDFDRNVQFYTARGYAVFQANFRGSNGFGDSFVRAGHGEWGRKMQDDLTDGIDYLVKQELVDPARICIVGASYGGYAALAGAAFTPDLYKCAVSIAGIGDIPEMLKFDKKRFGEESATYDYVKSQVGDPEKEAERLLAISPIRHVQAIKAPILLVHGVDDGVVDFEQSVAMKRALDKSGRPTELIRLKDEGHSYWSWDNEKLVLNAIDAFLWKHLGPGHNVTTPPEPPEDPKKKKKK